MTSVRRSFADELKREAVALLQTSGRPLMQIASELGIQPSMYIEFPTWASSEELHPGSR